MSDEYERQGLRLRMVTSPAIPEGEAYVLSAPPPSRSAFKTQEAFDAAYEAWTLRGVVRIRFEPSQEP